MTSPLPADGAAGYTTCGRRAGSLYHERQDAKTYKSWGVSYLKYDDCGEANIQSYAKYMVMKDALVAAYGRATPIDYYRFAAVVQHTQRRFFCVLRLTACLGFCKKGATP